MQIQPIALKGIARYAYTISDGNQVIAIDPAPENKADKHASPPSVNAVVLTGIPQDRLSAHRLLQDAQPGLTLSLPAKDASGWKPIDIQSPIPLDALELGGQQRILRLADQQGKATAYFTGTLLPGQLEAISEAERTKVPVYTAWGEYPDLQTWSESFYEEPVDASEEVWAYNRGEIEKDIHVFGASSLLSSEDVEENLSNGSLLLDMRAAEAFADGHIPRSLNLPPGKAFLRHIHRVIDADRRFMVVCDEETQAEADAALALAGLKAEGYWLFDPEAWTAAGGKLDMLVWLDEEELGLDMRFSSPQLIDTRHQDAFREGTLGNAMSVPPDAFDDEDALPAGDQDAYLFCHDGANSFLFASMLKARGRHRVRVLLGGLQAAAALWQNGPVPQATNSNLI